MEMRPAVWPRAKAKFNTDHPFYKWFETAEPDACFAVDAKDKDELRKLRSMANNAATRNGKRCNTRAEGLTLYVRNIGARFAD